MRFSVTLDQTLLTVVQEQALWVVATEGASEDLGIPDFLSRLDTTPLANSVPDTVGLIGISPR